MKKKTIIGVTFIATVLAGMLSACGKPVETSFGLEDYEGLYCMTGKDEIEGYEVTYTWGYQFNGDGTGVCYGQDEIDITWDETSIHNGDYEESFVMKPGKLIVGDIEYDKVEGKFITPNPCVVNVDNIEDGIYHAYIGEYGITEDDGKQTINAEIYTEDTYDIVDINRMTEGDVIYIKGGLMPVKSINHTDSGIIDINGGVENNGSALIAEDESICFVYAGMDMERSYTCHGEASLTVSGEVKLIDKRNPSEDKEYTGSDAVFALKEMVHKEPLNCYNGLIFVENNQIVEINRLYTP